jgi:hypothetical protein
VPFGRHCPQLFVHENIGPLCLRCARTMVPDAVALAEAMEANATAREEDNN